MRGSWLCFVVVGMRGDYLEESGDVYHGECILSLYLSSENRIFI